LEPTVTAGLETAVTAGLEPEAGGAADLAGAAGLGTNDREDMGSACTPVDLSVAGGGALAATGGRLAVALSVS
jgi:hypothetical protein